MTRIWVKPSTTVYMESIEGEQDLELKPGFSGWYLPPPEDGRCQCCGRHLDELTPFGKMGDPIMADFEGALLVRRLRPLTPPPVEHVRIWKEFYGNCNTDPDRRKARRMLVKKHGKQKAYILDQYHSRPPTARRLWFNWECYDCIVLDDSEYLEKRGNELDESLSITIRTAKL
jgi:hypothetical protein